MISDTIGFRHRRKRNRLTDTACASIACPHQRYRGYCRLFKAECDLRKKLLEEFNQKRLNGESEDEVKDKNAPGLEEQLTRLLGERCPFRHARQGGPKPVRTTETYIAFLESLLSLTEMAVPRAALRDEDTEEEEEGVVDSDDVEESEQLRSVTIRSGASVDISNLRVLAVHHNEQLLQSSSQLHLKDLIPEEFDLNNLQFLRMVLGVVAKWSNDKANPFVLKSLRCQHNEIVNGEQFCSTLKSLGLQSGLISLDLAYNKLDSVRLLFHLRSDFPALLNLSLRYNPATRKPDYREQVRTTLPNLIRLDDTYIRRPPLDLPYPTRSTSFSQLHDEATTALVEFFTAIEKGELDEDTASAYLHPSITMSCAADQNIVLFDPARYKNDDGCEILSMQDRNELESFSICVRAKNRDLLLGRIAVDRAAHGPVEALTAYLTLYPPRFFADHHLGYSTVSTVDLPDLKAWQEKMVAQKFAAVGAVRKRGAQKPAEPSSSELFRSAAEPSVLITLHGPLSWRTPTMKGLESLKVTCHRTITMTKLNGRFLVRNDLIQLSQWSENSLYQPARADRVERLAHVFDLSDETGRRLVVKAMERTTSDRALFEELTTVSDKLRNGQPADPAPETLMRSNSMTKLL